MAEDLDNLREAISNYLKKSDFEGAGIAISKAVPSLLQLSVDEWVEDDDVDADGDARTAALPFGGSPQPGTASKEQLRVGTEPGESDSDSSSSSDNNSGDSDSDDGDDNDDDDDDNNDGVPLISSYRYRSMIHLPRNPRLEHLCTWLYDTVVRADGEEEPEEEACQRLPAAILAAWRRLQQQQQVKQGQIQLQQQQEQDGELGAATAAAAAAAAAAVLPPTEALHLQHSTFSAPYCTWRPVAPDALPPLHDVLVGVLRVCWDRHNDREPSRNIIWGAQRHSRRDDPVTAYLYIEYLRLLLVSIIKSRAEPLWLWHELQEVIEEYPHWRHHPHEVAVLARMMAEHGCGWLLLNSLLDHIGKAPLLMYGAWAALWDGLRRPEARSCCRLAAKYGVSLDAVWVHVAELTLLQVKEHPRDLKLLARAVAVLTRVLAITPAPAELASLLRAERDAPGSCEGVRHVTSQLRLDELLVQDPTPTF
ncbi:hypothetical protein Vretimale_12938 [Volvox reticuliferus]|uniref:Uncharacterized protein n=1 Tax=Volvox reticuliferus TaxID=1737510 RepID=A0A8J4CK18_9CHLO|nr:hypothetical protein Vretifemale_9301 [Volvox reticuliferus]GIM09052.1 hypothetical protein Vretimale_12938 [Volvox reticuliferus]